MTAAEKILQKALVGSSLGTAGWDNVAANLRDRAFFSAKVEDARILHAARQMCAEVAEGRRSPSEFRRDMRALLAKMGHPQGNGGLTDLYSQRRLDVLRETNVQQARGYAQHLEGTTEGALIAFPAQELVRIEDREHPRNWEARWQAAGGRFSGGGRMIALKGDPVWTKISRFGTPWPPFDFNSGMGVEDIDRDEAVSLGLIAEDDPPQEIPDFGFNDDLEAELPPDGIAETDKMLRETFGDQVDIRGTTAHWNAGLIRGMFRGTGQGNAYLGKGFGAAGNAGDEALAKRIRDTGLTVTRQWMATHGVKHKTPSGKAETNLPLSEGDFELIPSLWRHPDGVSVHSKNEVTLSMDTFDGGKLVLGVNLAEGAPTTFRKERLQGLHPSFGGGAPNATARTNQAHQPPKGKEER